MSPHLQNGHTPLMLGIDRKAGSVVALLLDKMVAFCLCEDALTTVDRSKWNVLHHAAYNDMGDTIEALLNANEAHVKAALAAQTKVISGTTIGAVPNTVCARG